MSLISNKMSIDIDTNQQTTISDMSQSIDDQVSSKLKRSNKTGILKKAVRQQKYWTQDEDRLLVNYVQVENLSWIQTAKLIPGRNASQCFQRYRRLMPKDMVHSLSIKNRHKWTSFEDNKLIRLVDIYGKTWKKITSFFPGMSSRIVRGRYLNHLQKGLINQKWSESEDLEIIKLYHTYGNKWSQIAKELGGRSENNVKNRFHSYLKKKVFGLINPYQVVSEVL